MIGFLRGRVIWMNDLQLILLCEDIGYRVWVNSRSCDAIERASDKEVSLWIETVVIEEKPQLVGFFSLEEQALFRALLTVQGVGLKASLSLLALFTPSQLVHVVHSQDSALLRRAEGIGPRIAQRIITELSNRLEPLLNTGKLLLLAQETPALCSQTETDDVPFLLWRQALEALRALGYAASEAEALLSEALKSLGEEERRHMTVEELIQKVLVQAAARLSSAGGKGVL